MNVTVDGTTMPPFVPQGLFKLELGFYANNSDKHYALLRAYGEVVNPDWN
jgi:hypothetical protein